MWCCDEAYFIVGVGYCRRSLLRADIFFRRLFVGGRVCCSWCKCLLHSTCIYCGCCPLHFGVSARVKCLFVMSHSLCVEGLGRLSCAKGRSRNNNKKKKTDSSMQALLIWCRCSGMHVMNGGRLSFWKYLSNSCRALCHGCRGKSKKYARTFFVWDWPCNDIWSHQGQQ